MDKKNPWMYCTQCHDYYVPTVKKDETSGQLVPKSVLRVPMRNRLEALYTRWHMDLGFVHMREELLKIFPKLEDQLPTADEVLNFHKVRQQWVKAVQEQALPVADDLRNFLDNLELNGRNHRIYDQTRRTHLYQHLTFALLLVVPIENGIYENAFSKIWFLTSREIWCKICLPYQRYNR